jgi:hypothetical protein
MDNSTHTRDEKLTQNFNRKTCEEYLKDPCTGQEDDIRINFEETGYEDADWIHLAQDRIQWRILVNTAMNLQVP